MLIKKINEIRVLFNDQKYGDKSWPTFNPSEPINSDVIPKLTNTIHLYNIILHTNDNYIIDIPVGETYARDEFEGIIRDLDELETKYQNPMLEKKLENYILSNIINYYDTKTDKTFNIRIEKVIATEKQIDAPDKETALKIAKEQYETGQYRLEFESKTIFKIIDSKDFSNSTKTIPE